MLQSDLCDYSDAYIIVKGTITVAVPNNDPYNKKLDFKNNVPFISCILKKKILIDNAKDLEYICIICLSAAKIIQKQQEVFRITAETKQIVVQ